MLVGAIGFVVQGCPKHSGGGREDRSKGTTWTQYRHVQNLIREDEKCVAWVWGTWKVGLDIGEGGGGGGSRAQHNGQGGEGEGAVEPLAISIMTSCLCRPQQTAGVTHAIAQGEAW